MSIGENIKSARKRAGLTQEQLAKKSGVATVTIRQYEGEKRTPRVEQLSAIADALSLSLQDLTDPASYDAGFNEGAQAQEYQYKMFLNLQRRAGYSYSQSEGRLISAFSKLNDCGKERAIELLKDLTEVSRYTSQDGGACHAIKQKKDD